jgi:hypothetical protein
MNHATTTLIVLKQLAGHVPPHLDPLQSFIERHIDTITNLWISVWWITALILLYKLWHEYKEQRKNGHGR